MSRCEDCPLEATHGVRQYAAGHWSACNWQSLAMAGKYRAARRQAETRW